MAITPSPVNTTPIHASPRACEGRRHQQHEQAERSEYDDSGRPRRAYVWNEEEGRFTNTLQDWQPTEGDFDEIARVNAANVKNAPDGGRIPYVINGFFFLIGTGHDAYNDWAEGREEKGVQASIRGEVRVRKAGIRGAGYIDVSGCPPMSQQLVIDSVARFSEKEVRFV